MGSVKDTTGNSHSEWLFSLFFTAGLKMRVAIVGGRDFDDYVLLRNYGNILTEKLPRPHIVIVSGGAKGADTLAEQFAREHRYDSQIFP